MMLLGRPFADHAIPSEMRLVLAIERWVVPNVPMAVLGDNKGCTFSFKGFKRICHRSRPHVTLSRKLRVARAFWAQTSPCTEIIVISKHGKVQKGSLQLAVDLSATGDLGRVAQELAWRKARFAWILEFGHIASEDNKTADALSRIFAPNPEPVPRHLLAIDQDWPLEVGELWKLDVSRLAA